MRERQLPVGPSQPYRETTSVQDVSWRLGDRICLLKGCEQSFRARHPLSRYCSPRCRAAARRWRRRAANRRYRSSEQGKCRRRAQACRYRKRVREGQRAACRTRAEAEGYPNPEGEQPFPCRRPGCYDWFTKSARSLLRKFCSPGCRRALRRVLIRERRWKRRLLRERKIGWRADDSR